MLQLLGDSPLDLTGDVSLPGAIIWYVPLSKTLCHARLQSTPQLLLYSVLHHTTIKITSEFRNVGDADYAMSHAAAEACTQRLAAGRGHGYRHAALSLQPERGTGSGPAC